MISVKGLKQSRRLSRQKASTATKISWGLTGFTLCKPGGHFIDWSARFKCLHQIITVSGTISLCESCPMHKTVSSCWHKPIQLINLFQIHNSRSLFSAPVRVLVWRNYWWECQSTKVKFQRRTQSLQTASVIEWT